MVRKTILLLAVILILATPLWSQTPNPQPLPNNPIPAWSFSTAGGFSTVSNAPSNNGFVSVTELKLSTYIAIRGDVFLVTNPQVIGSYVGPEYIFPANKLFKSNPNNPVNADNVEFFGNVKFGDLRSTDPANQNTKSHFSWGIGAGFNIKMSDKTFIRPLDISYLRGSVEQAPNAPASPFHAVLGNHLQLGALLGVRF